MSLTAIAFVAGVGTLWVVVTDAGGRDTPAVVGTRELAGSTLQACGTTPVKWALQYAGDADGRPCYRSSRKAGTLSRRLRRIRACSGAAKHLVAPPDAAAVKLCRSTSVRAGLVLPASPDSKPVGRPVAWSGILLENSQSA